MYIIMITEQRQREIKEGCMREEIRNQNHKSRMNPLPEFKNSEKISSIRLKRKNIEMIIRLENMISKKGLKKQLRDTSNLFKDKRKRKLVETMLLNKMKRNSRKLISLLLRKTHIIKNFRGKWISNLRNTLKENHSRWILNLEVTLRISLTYLGMPKSIRNLREILKKRKIRIILEKTKERDNFNKKLMNLEKILKKIKNSLKLLMINY